VSETHISIGYESPNGLGGFSEMILEGVKEMAPANSIVGEDSVSISFEDHTVSFSMKRGVRFHAGRPLQVTDWAPWREVTLLTLDYVGGGGDGVFVVEGGVVHILKGDCELQVLLGLRGELES